MYAFTWQYFQNKLLVKIRSIMIHSWLITIRGVGLRGLGQGNHWFIHTIFNFYNDTIFMYGSSESGSDFKMGEGLEDIVKKGFKTLKDLSSRIIDVYWMALKPNIYVTTCEISGGKKKQQQNKTGAFVIQSRTAVKLGEGEVTRSNKLINLPIEGSICLLNIAHTPVIHSV